MVFSPVDTKKEIATEVNKNMILYGPPGTGKTYHTAIYAVRICDKKSWQDVADMGYEAVMDRFEKLKKDGRVQFTTFHQSYGYEEFIEGIRPAVDEASSGLRYTVEPGVFKRFCEGARKPEAIDIPYAARQVWAVRNRAGDPDVPYDLKQYLYQEGVILVEDIRDEKRQCDTLGRIENGDWVVLGRGLQIDAVGVVTDYEPSEIDKKPFYWKRNVKWLATDLGKTFCDIGKEGTGFSNFAVAKSKLKIQDLYPVFESGDVEKKPYVFIIDEINRGNISKIFGELITLIEDTKREGMSEQASAVLPYSGEEFSVPENVYIIGTMNTADRSISLVDTALRRRFQFIEMMPDAEVLRKIGADKVGDLDVVRMLNTINDRITLLYDREHTIGHAYFTKLAGAGNQSVEILQSIFETTVIPLLQEYFYEDYEKIQFVLGDNGKTDPEIKFIKDEDIELKNVFKGDINRINGLPEKRYTVNRKAFSNLESYRQIM